jgi:hypothetical protein
LTTPAPGQPWHGAIGHQPRAPAQASAAREQIVHHDMYSSQIHVKSARAYRENLITREPYGRNSAGIISGTICLLKEQS